MASDGGDELDRPLVVDALGGRPLLLQLLYFSWGNYDEEEKAVHRGIRRKDCVGCLVVVAFYLALAWCTAPAEAAAAKPPWPPAAVLALQALFAAWGLYTLYLQTCCQPKPLKDPAELFRCLKGPFGRWIYLTRQTLAVQAVHLTASALAPLLSPRLAAGAYALTIYVGAQATFVTIQFFTLVNPQAEFKKLCERWAFRGIHFKLICRLTHVPGACLTLADICIVKQRAALLGLSPPYPVTLLIVLSYTVFYIGMLFANHGVTGEWPYTFLYNLDWRAWIKFIVVQTIIITLLSLYTLTLSRFGPSAW